MTLYKYLSPSRIKDLENCMIRFTPPESFNDPFEGRPSDHGSRISDNTIQKLLDFDLPRELREKIFNETFKHLKTEYSLGRIAKEWSLEMVRDDPVSAMQQAFEPESGPKKEIRLLYSTAIGILSLSEDPSHPLMWSHYADGHTGFVIGIDERHPCFGEEMLGGPKGLINRLVVGWKSGVHKVRYSSKRPSFGGKDHWNLKYNLIKSKHWRYEREQRIVAPLYEGKYVGSDENNLPIVLFPFAPEAVKSIIFGLKMNENDANYLLDVATKFDHYSHVDFYMAQIDARGFKLNLHQADKADIDSIRKLFSYFNE